MTLYLHNTLTRRKEIFTPIDAANVRMYVCGPTVYDRPHLGNARSVVVYDVLFRLLRRLYGEAQVNYVRNITDVDDKINARARERGIPISRLTQEVTAQFHEDMAALNVLAPTREPRATEHIPQMTAIIEALLENGHAYQASGHVLFDVPSYPAYGRLSRRAMEDQQAGARVEVEAYKRHSSDFVLWKPGAANDDPSSLFDSPWGKGRPGWHIECSAMSSAYLGDTFDLHGGGADLMFPHHENEIAQSCGAKPESGFAHYWVHNGFLTVGGEKMSKSLGNFITVRDLLTQGMRGEVIRYALMSARYSEPLDWNAKLLHDAKAALDKWYRLLESPSMGDPDAFHAALADDLNFPKALSLMHAASGEALLAMGQSLGFFAATPETWFKSAASGPDETEITARITARAEAKKAKNFAEADRIRNALEEKGIILEDRPGGTTDWRRA